MRKICLSIAFAVFSATGMAGEWRFFDEVGKTTSKSALICHLWSATIFAPGERGSCYMGAIYTVDLAKREIRYFSNGLQGLPSNRSERESNRSTLINSLKGEGIERLEVLRNEQEAVKRATEDKAAADRAHREYLTAFEAANTLEKIQEFEAKYGGNDPDGLIENLKTKRAELEYKQYRDDFTNAKTSSDLYSFISAYQQNDQDKLIPEAKKRRAVILASEDKARQAKEEEAREKLREAAVNEATARKENPNAWICKPGSFARFSGGVITGAGGNGFIDPVALLDNFPSKPENEKRRILAEFSLTVHFGNMVDGCTGIAYFDARRVQIAEPQGGGKLRGGKFIVVLTDLKTSRGLNAKCFIVVRSKDLSCN